MPAADMRVSALKPTEPGVPSGDSRVLDMTATGVDDARAMGVDDARAMGVDDATAMGVDDGRAASSSPLEALGVVHHFGMTVSDLARSIAFYCDFFGLSHIGGNRFQGEMISAQTGLAGTILETALLAGPNTIVELLRYESPQGASRAPRPCDVGAAHVCIVVEDIETVLARMRSAGIACATKPCSLVENTRMIYVSDPDGILVELLEPSPVIMLSTLLPPTSRRTTGESTT